MKSMNMLYRVKLKQENCDLREAMKEEGEEMTQRHGGNNIQAEKEE